MTGRGGWRVAHRLDDTVAVDRLERAVADGLGGLVVADDAPAGDPPSVVFVELGALARRGAAPTVPHRPLIVVTRGEPASTTWSAAERHRARWLIDAELLGDPVSVASVVRCAGGRPWRFDPSTWTEPVAPATTEIGSASARDEFISAVVGMIADRPAWSALADRVRLVAEELVNNALLHAFEAHPGNRYVPGAFDGLRGGDRVTARHGLGDGVLWMSITDNAGSLDGDTVRRHIRRHLAAEGLLDGGGRGLFIAFSLANVLAVNIDPGRSTEIAVAFHADLPAGRKLVMINGPDRG